MLPEDASSRPRSVHWAVSLALAAFAVALVNTYRFGPQVASQMDPLLMWTYTVATSALWLFLILLVFRGRNWARLTFSVLALLSIPGTVVVNALSLYDPVTRIVSASQAVLNVSAAVLLLIPGSAHWYRELRAARRRGAA